MFATNAATLAGVAGALLGWHPRAFWGATPAELTSIIVALNQRTAAVQPPSAAEIKALIERHPDE